MKKKKMWYLHEFVIIEQTKGNYVWTVNEIVHEGIEEGDFFGICGKAYINESTNTVVLVKTPNNPNANVVDFFNELETLAYLPRWNLTKYYLLKHEDAYDAFAYCDSAKEPPYKEQQAILSQMLD